MAQLARPWVFCAVATALGCGPKAEPATVNNPAATSAGTSAGESVVIQVERELFGVDEVVLSGPVLFKRRERGAFAIAFFNAGAKSADCSAFGQVPELRVPMWRLAEPIGGDGFAFLLDRDEGAFWNKLGGRRYTSWRLYYRKPGTGEPARQGAGPSTSNVRLRLATLSAELVRGSVSGTLTLSHEWGTTVKGSFEARVCP